MKLRSIRVESFKRFREAMTLADLAPGINLIAAPNGRGKSTLAEAVRVVFLERHRTASLGESLAPWSQPGANPGVQVEFERDGKVHRLAKTFGGRKSCSLVIEGGKSFAGDEAEQWVAELFSFSYSNKGVSKPEQHGVPGLLWVQQGTSGQIADEVAHAHGYISRALGDDIGELAATAGDKVIARVEAELAVLHTKGGKPTGEFARLLELCRDQSANLTALQAKIAEYRAAVDRLGALQEQHRVSELGKPWLQQRADAEQARQKLRALDEVAAQRREQELQLAVAQGRITGCQAELAALNAEDGAVAQRQAEEAATHQRNLQRQAAMRGAESALVLAQQADAGARAGSMAARRAADRRRHAEDLVLARQRTQDLQDRLRSVETQAATLALHQAESARLAAFAGADKRLQVAEARLSGARVKLEAVSTRLEFDLRGEGVRLGGEAVTGSGTRTIAEPLAIDIAGLGTIRVLPGAKDLSQLKVDCERAQREVDRLLQAMGVSTADEARQRELELNAAQAGVERLQAVIAGVAPAGLDALRQQASTAQGDEERHAAALAGLGPQAESPDVGSVEAADALEASAREALRKAQATQDAARADAASTQAQWQVATQELAAARARVTAPAREERRSTLRADLVSAEAQQSVHQREIVRLGEQILAALPDQLRQDIDRWTRSANALETEHGRVATELNRLAGQLQAQGALGLEEEAASLQEQLARSQRQADDRTRRAAALTHLLKVLTEKRTEVARGIRAPLQKRINHYLAIQFPGASLELDDVLRPHRIARDGAFGRETGSFKELSGGEREQVGIIARLAYADLLQEAGKPTLLMLDDSLVHSDRERLAQMKRVLYDAAQRHQILVFTCHQESWLDVGVAPRGLP